SNGANVIVHPSKRVSLWTPAPSSPSPWHPLPYSIRDASDLKGLGVASYEGNPQSRSEFCSLG
ncbi:hypothetical protein P3X46_019992, partial [Hevea brasiliensis]